MIVHAANDISRQIAHEIKYKLISLKIDITTRHGKHVLGISTQFFTEGEIVTRCIGMVEIFARHNAVNITQDLLKCLQTISCDVNQIYAIAIDNARNMVASIDRVRSIQEDVTQMPLERNSSDQEDDAELDLENHMLRELDGICSCVRCLSHTIELAAKDVIKLYESEITDIRNYIKRLKNIDHVQTF